MIKNYLKELKIILSIDKSLKMVVQHEKGGGERVIWKAF